MPTSWPELSLASRLNSMRHSYDAARQDLGKRVEIATGWLAQPQVGSPELAAGRQLAIVDGMRHSVEHLHEDVRAIDKHEKISPEIARKCPPRIATLMNAAIAAREACLSAATDGAAKVAALRSGLQATQQK